MMTTPLVAYRDEAELVRQIQTGFLQILWLRNALRPQKLVVLPRQGPKQNLRDSGVSSPPVTSSSVK